MSEQTSSGIPANLGVDTRSALTPEAIEGVLQDFRTWLQQAAERAEGEGAPSGEGPEFSWHQLVAEFTALRHEVNLQTRAARAQSEQNTEGLKRLGEAFDALQEARAANEVAAHEREAELQRPLLKTMVDVYDALALACREVQRVQAAMEDVLIRLAQEPQPVPELVHKDNAQPLPSRKRPWWRWWSGSAEASVGAEANTTQRLAELEARLAGQQQEIDQAHRDRVARHQAAEDVQQLLNSIVTGYTMGLQRIDRALSQHDLETLPCVGQPFDPESMEVVEVVAEPGREGTEVLEEIRRGYVWRGKLFRFAQVRVARP
jgi:molecular chaperone GrpE